MMKEGSIMKNNLKNTISKEEYNNLAIELTKILLQEDIPLEDIQYLSGQSASEIQKIALSLGKTLENDKN